MCPGSFDSDVLGTTDQSTSGPLKKSKLARR